MQTSHMPLSALSLSSDFGLLIDGRTLTVRDTADQRDVLDPARNGPIFAVPEAGEQFGA